MVVGPQVPPPADWIASGAPKVFPYHGEDLERSYSLDKLEAVSIYIYHPEREYTYDVRDVRVVRDGE